MVKKTFKKKIVKRKRKSVRTKASSTVGKELQWSHKLPLPPSWSCKFLYAETFNLTTGVLGIIGSAQLFRLNNIYDPNYTGTGHQPYGFNEISVFYSKYQVMTTKVTLIWSTIGGTADVQTCYMLSTGSNAFSLAGLSVDYATEQPAVNTGLLSASGSTRTVEQNVIVPMHKLFGVSKQEYADDSYISQAYGPFEPVAAKTAYISIGVGSPSGVAGEGVTCQVVMEYSVRFMERVTQAQS